MKPLFATLSTHLMRCVVVFLCVAAGPSFGNAKYVYNAYFGDLNSDGVDDVYLKPRVPVVAVPSDELFLLPLPLGDSYVVYSRAATIGGYDDPVVNNSLAVGSLTAASSNPQWTDVNDDNIDDIVVAIPGASDPLVLIVEGNVPTSVQPGPSNPLPGPVPGALPAPQPAGNPNPGIDTNSAKVGAVAGSFRVDESGSATYSIPITTIPGTAGVTPEVSLNYNSGAGNGLVGKGWSIGGLSAISRCRQTQHQDGNAKAITFSADDRFCLDGQRLVQISSGRYGAIGAEYRTEIDSYAKVFAINGSAGHPNYWEVHRKDGSISTYGGNNNHHSENQALDINGAATGNALSWAITRFVDSANNEIRYGYDGGVAGHRIREIRYAYGTANMNSGWRWDGHNARIYFHYEDRDDDISGYVGGYEFQTQKRLNKISVTNRTDGSGALLSVRDYKLSYKLNASHQKLSRLAMVEECVGNTCLKPAEFTWADDSAGTYGFGSSSNTIAFTTQNDQRVVSYKHADINGDGNLDLIWLVADWDPPDSEIHDQYWKYAIFDGDNNRFGPVQQAHADSANPSVPFVWHVLDYDGDGYTDLLVPNLGYWRVLRSSGRATNAFTPMISTGVPTTLFDATTTQLADVNADGLPDLVNGKRIRFMKRRDGGSSGNRPYEFDNSDTVVTATANTDCNCTAGANIKKFGEYGFAGDFNGDGKVDTLGQTITGRTRVDLVPGEPDFVPVYGIAAFTVNDQGNFQEYGEFPSSTPPLAFDTRPGPSGILAHDEPIPVDFNADGLTDILVGSPGGRVRTGGRQTTTWRLYLSTGSGFTPLGIVARTYYDNDRVYPMDYNGDGYPDLVWHNRSATQSKLQVSLWNGNGFDAAMDVMNTTGGEHIAHIFVDTNGDGHPDYTQLKSGETGYVRTHPHKGQNQVRNRITRIDNGLGNTTDITYTALTQGNYTRENNGADPSWDLLPYAQALDSGDKGDYPVIDILPAMYVVTNVKSTAPRAHDTNPNAVDINAQSQVSYLYTGAKMQGGGRGFLGFHKITSVDHQSDVWTTTSYRQHYPFIGRPEVTESAYVSTGETKKISTSVSYWGFQNWGSHDQPPYRLHVGTTSDVRYDWDTGDLLTQTLTSHHQSFGVPIGFDEWGNMTWSVVNTYAYESGSTDSTLVSTVTTDNTYLDTGLGATYSKEKGRLSRTVVTHQRPGQPDIVRTSDFNYHAGGKQKGLLKQEVIQPGTVDQLTTTHTYNDQGNRTKTETTGIVDAAGTAQTRYTRWEYDSQERFKDKTYQSNGQEEFLAEHVVTRHNTFGAPTQTRDINKIDTYIKYDTLGAPYHQYTETGTWRTTKRQFGFGYVCPAGTRYNQLVSTAEAGVNATVQCFDALGRETRRMNKTFDGADFSYVDTQYDSSGRVKRVSEPTLISTGMATHWTTTTYHPTVGRVEKITLPDNTEVTTTYDHLRTITTNAKGQTKSEFRNALGELTSVWDAQNASLHYVYDATGNLTRTQAKDNWLYTSKTLTTTLTYDVLGRKRTMNDPDKGYWSYQYNAFGELIKQTDAKGQISVLSYDALGRMTYRRDYRSPSDVNTDTRETSSRWYYDYPLDTGVTASQPGQLTRTVSSYTDALGNTGQEDNFYGFDPFHRVNVNTKVLKIKQNNGSQTVVDESKTYTETMTYDAYGRVFQHFDASGQNRGIENVYNAQGYLAEIRESAIVDGAQALYHKVEVTDVRGNVIKEKLGGYTTQRSYDAKTGRLMQISSHLANMADSVYQHLIFTYDVLGNIIHKDDKRSHITYRQKAGYCYDNMNRLVKILYGVLYPTGTTLSGCSTYTSSNGDYRYDAFGNITYKEDVGDYEYNSATAGPHAVSHAGGIDYTYDSNGNMVSDLLRSIDYTTYDKAVLMSRGDDRVAFRYGIDRSRFVRWETSSGVSKTTFYVGGNEIILNHNSNKTDIKRHIAGKVVITLTDMDSNGNAASTDTKYMLRDHLGSVVSILDNSGSAQEMSFDPWGQRTVPQSWISLLGNYPFNPAQFVETTNRGFTGHEMVDTMGLIHMNGRIYDPKLGRFMQADPFIDGALNTQGYNRFSYGKNNPLGGTDPSGYGFYETWMKLDGRWAAHKFTGRIPALHNIGITALNFIPGFGQLAAAHANFDHALANGGGYAAALRSGVISYASSAAFSAVGDVYGPVTGRGLWGAKGLVSQGVAHGLVGGVMSELQGGKFGHGFAAAGIGFAAGAAGEVRGWSTEAQFTASVIAGGTASKITGGKFANGALTASFGFIFNQMAHSIAQKDPILEIADALEVDGEFRFAKNTALRASQALGELQEDSFGTIVKQDRTLLQRFTKSGALNDIPYNKFSLTEPFIRTAYGPVQPESAGFIQAPATIQDAIAVGIYRYSNSRSVNYNAYARSVNAPVYVQTRGGGCVVYGSSSSRGC